MPIIFQNFRHFFLELFVAEAAPKVRYLNVTIQQGNGVQKHLSCTEIRLNSQNVC